MITAGRIETADGVGKKRFGSTGRVLMAGRVVIERLSADCRIVYLSAEKERAATDGRVLESARVQKERAGSNGGVVVANGVM